MTRACRCPSAEAARRQRSATPLLASSSESRSCAFVGEPLLNPGQPLGCTRSDGATALQGVAQVGRNPVGGDFGNGPPQFVGQPLSRVETRRRRSGGFRDERHDALDVEVRNGGCLRIGLNFDVVSHGENACDLFHFAQNGVVCLPRPSGSSHRGHAGDNLNIDAVVRRQVVGSQTAAYKSFGEFVGFGVFRQVGRARGSGREHGQREKEREQPAQRREVSGQHDGWTPRGALSGARRIVCIPTVARHSQTGMDSGEKGGEQPWNG